MSRSANVPLEDSIAQTLGALYQKKARSAMLTRVLEDYRRCCTSKTDRVALRPLKKAAHDAADSSQQELERLYLRRAAVDQVIRSIEAYSDSAVFTQSRR